MTAALILALVGAAFWVGALTFALALCRASSGRLAPTPRRRPARRRTSRPPIKEWLI